MSDLELFGKENQYFDDKGLTMHQEATQVKRCF